MEIKKQNKILWKSLYNNAKESTVFTSWEFNNGVDTNSKTFVLAKDEEPIIGVWASSKPFPYAKYQGLLTNFKNSYSSRKKFNILDNFFYRITKYCDELRVVNNKNLEYITAARWPSKRNGLKIDTAIGCSAVIDLTIFKNFGMYIDKLEDNRRRDYKKFNETKAKVSPGVEPGELYRLIKLTFQRQNIPLMENTRELVNLYHKFSLKHGRCNKATLGGKPIAATLFLHDSEAGYYVMGGNDPNHRDTGASTALIIDQIKYCYKNGLDLVDLLSSNDPGRGTFKLSFSAAPLTYIDLFLARIV